MRWLVFVVVAACSAEPAPQPGLSLSLAVALSTDSSGTTVMHLRAHGSDRGCECYDHELAFPALGECIWYTDVPTCRCALESCLQARLVGDGVPQDLVFTSWYPYGVRLPAPMPPGLALQLEGCGHEPFDIPLAAYEAPIPTLSVDVSEETIDARWRTDVPAASTWVTLAEWSTRECHTTDSEMSRPRASTAPLPVFAHVAVTTLLPLLEHPTPAGVVHIWRGNSARVDLYEP